MDISEIRRINLQRLVDGRFGGNKSALAHEAGKQASYISRCLIADPENRHRKKIGETLARELESELGLRPRELDEQPDSSKKGAAGEQVGRVGVTPPPAAGNGQLDSLLRLRGKLTTRSRDTILRIAKAAEAGRISDDDMELLERIAKRFEHHNDKTP